MNYKVKTKEELVIELQELQKKYDSLESAFDKELAVNEEKKYDLERIIYASKEFILFSDDTFDHSRILQTLLDISGAKYASFNIFDENGLDFTTVDVAGISDNIKKAMSLLGFDPINKKWKHDPVRAEKMKNQTITRFENLHDLTGNVMPKGIVNVIEKKLDIGDVFVISIVKNTKVLGDFTLLFNKGETLSNNKFVDLYTYMVGMFLERNILTNSLRTSEAKLSSMITNISDVIGIINTDGVIKFKSTNIEKWFGWKPQDIIGTDGWQTVHPEDLNRIQSEFTTLLKKENSAKTVEYRYKCKDGSYKPVQLSATNLTNDPVIKGVLLNYHDITERKQAEKEIKMLADALKSINDGISITDLEDNIIFVNDSFSRIYGYSKEELIGRSIDIVRSPNNFSEIVKGIKVATLNGRWDGELINTRKDGSEFPISLTTSVIQDSDGNPFTLIGVFVDITERKRVEKQLIESEEKYRNIFENVQDVFYTTDLDGTIHEISPSVKYYTEFDRDELIGTNVENLYNDPEDRKIVINSLLKDGEVRDYEVKIRTKTGNTIYGSANARLIINSRGGASHIVGAIRDITERKRIESLLKLKNDQLIKAINDKDLFISILAHDLRSPFNTLLGYSNLLKANIHSYDIERIKEFVNIISNSANNTFDLLEELLMWAQTQSEKISFEPKKMSFSPICSYILEILGPNAKEKDISINYFADKDISFIADINMIKTVLRNLISNAIKFTNGGGRIDIRAEQNNANTTISVSDNGIGIEPESIKKLFDISQIRTTPGTASEVGSGLGLFLCKDFVEKHGGKIWVNSEFGIGSIFYFTIPCKLVLDLGKTT